MKKPLWRRILKWSILSLLSIIVLCLIVIGVVVNFVFTPSKLTPMVQKTVQEFLNADVQFSKVELTFFSTFPDFGLEVTDMNVVSQVFRDTMGGATKQDSLMSVKRCLVTVNPMAYLTKNRIVVKEFILDSPHIYAYIDTAGVANWDIMKADTTVTATAVADTTTDNSPMARLSVKGVKMNDGQVIFDDRSTQLYTRIDSMGLAVDGSLGQHRAKLKLNFTSRNILFWQEGKLLVKKLALGVETEMRVNRDSLLCRLSKAVFDVNGVKFGAGGTLRADSVARTIDVDLKYGVHISSLKTLLDMVPEVILKKAKQVDARGEVLCEGTIKGVYGKKSIPVITTCFKITNGYIAYEGMPSRIDTLNMDVDAFIDLQKEQSSWLRVESFCMKGGETDIDLEGMVENLLTSPAVKAKLDADVNFDDLTRIFPLSDGITCKGSLQASLKADILVDDIVAADYGKLKVGGWCKMKDIAVFIPKDSIVVNIKSAGLGFATNWKNEKVVQGVDLLNGAVGYSGLEINVRKHVTLKMDTTYLTLKTSPLRDTSSVALVSSTLHLGRTVFILRDTLLLGVKGAEVKAGLSPSKRNKKVPAIHAEMKVDSLRVRMLGNRLNMAKADIMVDAVRSRRDTSVWIPSGYVDFEGLRAYTPYFPVRIKMPGTKVRFDRHSVVLDSARLRLGRSDVRITGSITNLSKAFFKHEELKAELFVKSDMIDCNQLMRALDKGTAYMAKVNAGFRDSIGSSEEDMDQLDVVGDSIQYEGNNTVFVVPKGIDLKFQTDIRKVKFGHVLLNDIHGEMSMKNQCIQLEDLHLSTSAAHMNTSAVYRATDTLRAYAGFALQMHDIRIDSLVRMIPSMDTLFPMLRSFEGEVDFHIAAETWFDSTMTIELQTLRAAAYLDGHNLVLMDGETFSEISKMLMFKNKKRNVIDSISVDLRIQDGSVEIFPFMVEIDRYKAAIGGMHNIDMSFNYHISILKSPLPFRAGVDISGNIDKMKFKITKAKYKDLFMPSRKAKIDSTQLNLKKKIRDVLRTGDH